MGSAQAIANYERLSVLTGRMREAAALGDWERLISIERECAELVTAMKRLDAEVKLDDAARQRKIQLITGILADDAEIRNFVQVWMGQLQEKMQSNRQEQRLLKAYGI